MKALITGYLPPMAAQKKLNLLSLMRRRRESLSEYCQRMGLKSYRALCAHVASKDAEEIPREVYDLEMARVRAKKRAEPVTAPVVTVAEVVEVEVAPKKRTPRPRKKRPAKKDD